ncbi:hypothetical protein [Sulfurimonas sp. CS5]|uniref:hypothetical protein n=1 Tax=Sulfurimonas sp. CS5 TaxID=3391145 RepID=UPI0039EBBF01
MPDNNVTQATEYMELLHTVVSNDWFLLFAGLASIISLGMALFAVSKVIKIDKSIHQKQSGTGNIQSAGDVHTNV